jgi:DNA-directed RNA polymerase specialized sigma54-like protein
VEPESDPPRLHVRLSTRIIQEIEVLSMPLVEFEERIKGLPLPEMLEGVSELRRAGPRTPELGVVGTMRGRVVVGLLEENVPRLRIRDGLPSVVERWIERTRGLLEAIDRRNGTMRRVAKRIFEEQGQFLEKGPESILPLSAQKVADDLGIHVSTIRCAVRHKWIRTPHGDLPLASFLLDDE